MSGLSRNYCNREWAGREREIAERLLEAELNFNAYLRGGGLPVDCCGLIFPIPHSIDCCLPERHWPGGGSCSNDFPGGIDVGDNNHVTLDIRLRSESVV